MSLHSSQAFSLDTWYDNIDTGKTDDKAEITAMQRW